MSARPEQPPRPLRVALGEYDTGWHDPAGSLTRAEALVARARRAGARLVVLPEMATTGFSMQSGEVAEPMNGPSVTRLAQIAAAHGLWILAGVATSGVDGDESHAVCAYNSAILLTPNGQPGAVYHKQKLFAYAGEDQSYRSGAGSLIIDIDGVRISPFICYDLRFPELFRAVADRVDAIVVVANWPKERRAHWDVLVRARAIENQCYVVAVNRTGNAGGLEYDGGSVAYGPWGEPLASMSSDDAIQVVELDPRRVADVRSKYPFLRDQGTPALEPESVITGAGKGR